MNRIHPTGVPSPMHRLLRNAPLLIAFSFLASCATDPGQFNGKPGGSPQRKSSGNAPLDGPSAGDVIHQTRYDHERRDFLDRIDHRNRRHYGNYR